MWWAALFTLPLLFVGLAIVHRVVALKGWGVQWLVLFYIALVLLDPVSQLLMALAFVDTWLNVRGRVKPKPDRKSTRLNSSHVAISYAVFCLKKKKSDGRR